MKTSITGPKRIAGNLFTWVVFVTPIVAVTAVVSWPVERGIDQRAGLCADERVDQLMFGASQGDICQVRRVLSKRVDVNRGTDVGLTALMCASAGPRATAAESVRLLIGAGADVNLADRFGTTPLTYAVMSKNDDAAERLLAAGADPNARNCRGFTALHAATLRGYVPPLLQVLLDNGANRDARDDQGKTPLDYAKDDGNTAAMEVLEAALAARS